MLVAGEDVDEKYKHIHMLKWKQKGRDSKTEKVQKTVEGGPGTECNFLLRGK